MFVTRIGSENAKALISLAKKEDVSEFISILGLMPKDELYEVCSRSAMVTVPSVWPEPLPTIAMEANMLGVPVVASSIRVLPEVVEDGVTGLLVEPNDPEALAEGIIKVLHRDFPRKEVHEVTKRKFNTDKIINIFLSFLQKLS